MEDQARIDAEHLRLLVIFHYVVASAMAFFACIPILHVVVGAAMILHKFPADKSGGPPYLMGWIFLLGGGTFVILGWSLAVATLFAARSLTRRRRYLYCLVIAGIMAASLGNRVRSAVRAAVGVEISRTVHWWRQVLRFCPLGRDKGGANALG